MTITQDVTPSNISPELFTQRLNETLDFNKLVQLTANVLTASIDPESTVKPTRDERASLKLIMDKFFISSTDRVKLNIDRDLADKGIQSMDEFNEQLKQLQASLGG